MIESYFALFIEKYFKLNIFIPLKNQKIAFLAHDMKCEQKYELEKCIVLFEISFVIKN